MFIQHLFEDAPRRVVVTYPGRFQPFHKGHRDVFASLQSKFGRDNVWIVTSNKTDDYKSPFNFSDKVRFMHAAGIPDDRIIETDRVYDLPAQFQPFRDQVVFITVVGAPDAKRLNPGATKKDGTPAYFQKLPSRGTDMQSADRHGYVIVEPEHPESITIGRQQYDVSHGTPTRDLWNQIRNNPKKRAEFLVQLYGRNDPNLGTVLDKIPTGAPEPRVKPTPKLKKPESVRAPVLKAVKMPRPVKEEADIPPPENARKTQIAGTLPTYHKGKTHLDTHVPKGRTLDFGAGLGGGAAAIGADSYEPYPAKGFEPTYTKADDIPDNSYERITNFNVLNVVPQSIRDMIVGHIGRILAPGGVAVITTRGRDVMTARGDKGPEPMSRITTIGTYQKGFTRAELRDYVERTLGTGFEVSALKLGPAGVMVKKTAKDSMQEDAAGVGVVKKSKDPRYSMATMGDDNDVDSSTLGKMMKAYDLVGSKSAAAHQKPVKKNVGTGIKESRGLDISHEHDESPVANAIMRRMRMKHMDAVFKYGPDAAVEAANAIAGHVGEVHEIGGSDVTAWTNEALAHMAVHHKLSEWAAKATNEENVLPGTFVPPSPQARQQAQAIQQQDADAAVVGRAKMGITDVEENSLSGPTDLESDYAKKQVQDLLAKQMGKLPPKEEQMLRLHFFQDMTATEIAKETGTNRDYVNLLIAKGLSNLRKPSALLGQPQARSAEMKKQVRTAMKPGNPMNHNVLRGTLDAYTDVREAAGMTQMMRERDIDLMQSIQLGNGYWVGTDDHSEPGEHYRYSYSLYHTTDPEAAADPFADRFKSVWRWVGFLDVSSYRATVEDVKAAAAKLMMKDRT